MGEEWRCLQGPPGVRKSPDAVAGRRSRRSRSPVRHAPSSPQEGRPVQEERTTVAEPEPRRSHPHHRTEDRLGRHAPPNSRTGGF
ncbi:MAG: hypothetical protein DI549_14910 [Ancylobacter novellus]|uniref:Uncharacterized protein n=1 Tax=Ancylobacter novellus TaxID=921 RepID=A0A2W5SEH3_ANCNO|nr:MAG: hypothetical protein DI549_14910 [Ancylobacter novellus]